MLQIDMGVAVTAMIALISLAAWVGSLSQRVKRSEKDINCDRKDNRQDFQRIFEKLEEINKYIRNGK